HGIFAGVSLEGATLRPDNDDNTRLYGRPITQREILHGDVAAPAAEQPLITELNSYAPFKKGEGTRIEDNFKPSGNLRIAGRFSRAVRLFCCYRGKHCFHCE